MAWRQTKVEDEREYLVKSYMSKLYSMKDLCDECGVSRKTGYKWYQRYMSGGFPALRDSSRAPKSPFRKYSAETLKRALDVKLQYPKYGPKKIYAILKRKFPKESWPSPTRLYEIFKEHHLVCSRKLRRRVPRTHSLEDVNNSNDVRCQHLECKTFEDVWKVYRDAFDQYGLPLRIRTDNGPPFATTGVGRLSRLAVNLIKAGVTPEWITPGHPEENGSHERFHRSLKAEAASPPADTFEEQLLRLEEFTEEYNFERPHEALNQNTPGSLYEPSKRQWDGTLRSPEYDMDKVIVRKVGSNGCIWWKRKGFYIGQLLKGEYLGLKEIDNGHFYTYYGPVCLGVVIEGVGFQRPEMPGRRRSR